MKKKNRNDKTVFIFQHFASINSREIVVSIISRHRRCIIWFYTCSARSTAAHSHTSCLHSHTHTHILLFIRSKNVNHSNPFIFYTVSRESHRFFIPPRSRARVSPGGLINFDVSSFFAAWRMAV